MPVVLAPDSAFALGPLARPRRPDRPLARQARTDRERAVEDHGRESFDWLAAPSRPGERIALLIRGARLAVATGALADGRRGLPPTARAVLRSYDSYAAWSVSRGAGLLAAGEIVITDRLHGHILCVLMGIPHVVLPDRHGKIRHFWETWTSRSSVAHWANDLETAQRIANGLHAADAPSPRG